MLAELRLLLDACDASASLQAYKLAVVEQNVLLKPTLDARKKSILHLHQLYGLSPDLLIFRVLRELWQQQSESQPLLALLCALARDRLLRATVELVTSTKADEPLSALQFQQAIDAAYPGQLSPKTLASAGRNVISSWEQAGYLRGSKMKRRQPVQPTPVVSAYALFLAYLNGERGAGMFDSPWCRVLDQPTHILRAQAEQASIQGWLEYRFTGQVIEITFRHFSTVPVLARNERGAV